MGKKTKVGRQRRDRFYHLAKETGFRSRAAFKLIQLNRKFNFLERSKVLIDLCAAPGGWMQVAKQNMPVSSIVIGIDMYPMKPIPGCISLIEDITTDKCRVSLQKELKTWNADVVLHDGAPNLGKNWLHDAYSQNCLTLSALKLATSFLKEGGWFVSKVFRSKDYNCLLWVLKQLFKKVHVTKPAASRNESAEIFIVCQHYLAPAKIDFRLLNPNYVFKELETKAPVTVQSLLKSVENVKKVKADGYPEETSILHTKLPASVFIASDNPALILQDAYEIIIDDDDIANHPKTTDEIKKCCEDIKLLGKKELRSLLAWWKACRDNQRKDERSEEETETVVIQNDVSNETVDKLDEEEKELDEIDKQIKECEDTERRDVKRKRKKVNKERTKLQLKMNLHMRQKDDLGPTDEGDKDIFQLSKITSMKQLKQLEDQQPDVVVESENEEEHIRKPKKVKYDAESTYLDQSGMFYKSEESAAEESNSDIDSDTEGLGLKAESEGQRLSKPVKRVRFSLPEESDEQDEEETKKSHSLITDLDYRNVKDKRLSKAQLWFDKDVFKDVENEDDEDYELDKMTNVIQSMGGNVLTNPPSTTDNAESLKKGQKKSSFELLSKSKSQMIKTKRKLSSPMNDEIDEVESAVEKKRKKKERKTLDAEGLALGAMMVNSRKSKRDIIDEGWNRYAFNDENLPDWFVEDEKKHMHKNVLVPKELVEEYTKNREELNVRPIKKVVEAKARKKKRAIRKLEKLKKKLEGVMENSNLTEAEKTREAKQMYKKLNKRKPEVKYIVAKKHTAAKRVRRPKGLKGPYKVVDPRMKKDLRARVSKETKQKSKKSTNKIKKSYKPTRRRKN